MPLLPVLGDIIDVVKATVLPTVGSGHAGSDLPPDATESADIAAVAGAAVVGACMAALEGDVAKIDAAYGASEAVLVLAIMIVFVQALKSLNGIGPSNTGGEFDKASMQLSDRATGLLQSAAPRQWSGETAEEYECRIKERQDDLRQIAEADRKVARVLVAQASQVEQAREEFDYVEYVLIAALAYAGYLYGMHLFFLSAGATGGPGSRQMMRTARSYQVALENFVWVLVALLALLLLKRIISLAEEGSRNAMAFNDAGQMYAGVVSNVQGATGAIGSGVLATSMCSVVGFADMASGASNMAAEPEGMDGPSASRDASTRARAAVTKTMSDGLLLRGRTTLEPAVAALKVQRSVGTAQERPPGDVRTAEEDVMFTEASLSGIAGPGPDSWQSPRPTPS